ARTWGFRMSPIRTSFLLRCFLLLWLPAVFADVADGQISLPQMASARSRSGQFVVQAPAGRTTVPPRSLATNANIVRLEPALVTVSCERIRQLLWHEIGATAPWQGKIYLAL